MINTADEQSASPVERFVSRDFRVGDELYYRTRDRRGYGSGVVRVESVGRKWVQLSNNHRFDKTQELRADFFPVDGGNYAVDGDVFVSEGVWRIGEQVRNMLRRLADQIRMPERRDDLTPDDVMRAAEILRVSISD